MKHEMRSLSLRLLIAVGASTGVAQASEPYQLTPVQGRVLDGGHIYYNALTGERVVTVYSTDGQTAPADTGNSVPVWQAQSGPNCPGQGGTGFFFGVDDPTGGTSLSSNIIAVDYGDIQKDTVVDCIQVNWVAAHPDQWANGSNSDDGVVGVEELAGQWMVWDAEDGHAADVSTRLPVMSFTFFNLPGNTPDNHAAGAFTGWTADVDLVDFAGDGSADLSFELGDSDGDCQGAGFCNNDVDTNGDGIGDGVSISNADRNFDGLPDSDLDGDGLFDWGWSVRFFQPGTGNDFDSDSDTGVLPGSDSDTIGIGLALPEGTLIDNGDGTWGWDIDTSAVGAGLGAEDRFAIYSPNDVTGGMDYVVGVNFGGFSCTGSAAGGYVPAGIFQVTIYGPGESSCDGDLNGDGQVNFFDVSDFILCYSSGGIDCDFDPDLNDDGKVDFFDISYLIQAFNEGCDGGVLP